MFTAAVYCPLTGLRHIVDCYVMAAFKFRDFFFWELESADCLPGVTYYLTGDFNVGYYFMDFLKLVLRSYGDTFDFPRLILVRPV